MVGAGSLAVGRLPGNATLGGSQIFDSCLRSCDGRGMAMPNSAESVPVSQDVDAPASADQSDLLAEILAAEADFARGPGQAHVRREHVFVITARPEPPVPLN